MTGKLLIVPTPIGNLEDITLRALKTLQSVDLILAEDKRKSSFLLNHYQIRVPLKSYHKFNERNSVAQLVADLQSGVNIALISDAGTPGISDPGLILIQAAIQEGINIECLPGPTALIPALILSGFDTSRFIFEGFLPHKKGKQTKLKAIAEHTCTTLFYESPHRITKTLEQMLLIFHPERKICICREISKKFEEVIRGTMNEVHQKMHQLTLLGEMVLVVEGKLESN